MIADSQVHIWAANSRARPWPAARASYVHGPGEFSASHILAEMDRAGVDRAVLVPAYCAGDANDIALGAAAEHPGRFAVMGRIPLGEDDDGGARQQLEKDLAEGMLGVRLSFLEREAHLLTDGSVDWLWAMADAMDFPVMVIAPGQLEKLGAIARSYPGLRMAVDHLGLTPFSDPTVTRLRLEETLKLAEIPNICVKASAFGWFFKEGYPFPTFLELARAAIDAFGARRVFWGTDFSRLDFDYALTVKSFDEHLGFRDEVQRRLVMGEGLCRWLRWV